MLVQTRQNIRIVVAFSLQFNVCLQDVHDTCLHVPRLAINLFSRIQPFGMKMKQINAYYIINTVSLLLVYVSATLIGFVLISNPFNLLKPTGYVMHLQV